MDGIGLGFMIVYAYNWVDNLFDPLFFFPLLAFLFFKMIGFFEGISRRHLIRDLEKHLLLKMNPKA